MRRFLVHMNHGGDNRTFILMFRNKTNRFFKECPNFSPFLPFEKLWAGRHQGLDHPNAVLSSTASGLGNLFLSLGTVFPLWLDKMVIEMTATNIHIGITGVFLLFSLVMGLNLPDFRSLVLGKAENGILRLLHRAHRLPSSQDWPLKARKAAQIH